MKELFISHGDESPSGDNLEYAPVFGDLMLAAQRSEERQFGNAVTEAVEPDPELLAEKAREVLRISHDLRAAVLLAEADLRMNGFPGFASVTAYIRFCLEDYWDTCHPELDHDDDDDPTMRVNAVLGLADRDTILRHLRLAPLTQSPAFGRITLRDLAIADGEIPKPDDMVSAPSQAAIDAAFKDTDDGVLEEILAAVQSARQDIAAINAAFDTHVPGAGPDLDPITRLLSRAVRQLSGVLGVATAEAVETEAGEAPELPGAPARSASAPGEIRSSRDVEMALDAIIRYYATYEPSSPLPILLHRAKRLVGADFMTIVNDLAPMGLENVRLLGGIEEEES